MVAARLKLGYDVPIHLDTESIKALLYRCHINGRIFETRSGLPSDSTITIWVRQNFWRIEYQGRRVSWINNAIRDFVLEKQQNPSKEVPD
ncbi:hypothetical protein PG5_02320 [Pseudomonas sp. G5(2012)]|nr:hypothetical protein PG5_02320 [Pseudomonas sp. G5(2012)]